MKQWFELHLLECQGQEADALSDSLFALGALSVSFTDAEDNPIFEPEPGTTPVWPSVNIIALFDQHDIALIAQACLSEAIPGYQSELRIIHDQDWINATRRAFKPRVFGKRLWICPSWHQDSFSETEPSLPKDAVVLELDPGLAFGTGSHPTTSLCLKWLDAQTFTEQKVLDYGCGSGILALAAAKLGAGKITAVDIDPQAISATEDNARQNGLTNNILQVGLPEILPEQADYDIIVANILIGPLMALKPRFESLLAANGRLVVSGILVEQLDTLKNHYEQNWHCLETAIEVDWAMACFARKV